MSEPSAKKTERSSARRTIQVDYLARVEGEGSLTIQLEGDRATEVRLGIFEPPRFFEALLRGRSFREAPDITSRICGICPVAYILSACHAMEDALGVRVTGSLRALRRLLYTGEWIESHGLHVFLLHAPDFLGYPDAMTMAKDHGDWVRKGLRIKKAGNAIVERLGGREIHPINVRVGGFYRAPTKGELEPLLPELRWAKQACAECLEWVSHFAFPVLERDYEFVALRHESEYPFCEGRIVSSKGIDIDPREFGSCFVEEQVPRSNALHARVRGRGAYLCGPLARFNLNFDRLSPEMQQLALDTGLTVPCTNPFYSIRVRLVEMAHAFEEALRIIDEYTPPAKPFLELPLRAATGHGCTEAPRGMLYHRYELDNEGTILDAKIVPPTSQNQRSIEEDLFALASELARLPHDEATHRAEQAIRNHDPCISCATHFLNLRFEERMIPRVVGLGQEAVGDDAVGLAVIDELARRALPKEVRLLKLRGPVELLSLAETSGPVVVVDAVLASPAGVVMELGLEDLSLRASQPSSSHGLGVAQAIELVQNLRPHSTQEPWRVVAVTVPRPDRYRLGLSPQVAAAVPEAADYVMGLL